MPRLALTVLAAILMIVPLATTASAQAPLPADTTVEQQDLVNNLITPTALAVADDGRVIVTSREGQVTVWEQDGTTTRAAFLDVDAYDRSGGQYDEQGRCQQYEECPAGYNKAEGGIHGILLAPDFMESGELYLYYTVTDSLGMDPLPAKHADARPWCAPIEDDACRQTNPETQPNHSAGNLSDEGKFRLSRFTLDLDTNILDVSSEVPLFENPAEWFFCCHYGGDLEWKNDGTLLMSVGDDTTSDESNGYSPHDTRANKTYNSAVLTSQNKADRRGKMLRIDVAEIEAGYDAGLDWAEMFDHEAYDGVPSAHDLQPNPFQDDVAADPYVYALGFRSNYRFAYNAEKDYVYVGTVGPDARNPNPNRGPAAHDEIEVVPPGGGTNHGWPICIADNIPYNQYDFETGTAGEPFSCEGLTPASVWYTYTPSDSSPYTQIGGGGNTAIGGEAYLRPDSGALRLPARYDNTLLWMEHSRGQLWRMPMNDDGSLNNSPAALEVVLGSSFPFSIPIIGNGLSNPIDSAVGPDGALYILESNGFWNSTAGILSRLTCAGCTPDPVDYGGVEVLTPAAPLAVASVDGGVTTMLPAAVIAFVIMGLLVLVGVRRREHTV